MIKDFKEVLEPCCGAVVYDSFEGLGLLVNSMVSHGKMVWYGLKIEGIERGEFEGDLSGCLFYDAWRSDSPECIGYVSEQVVKDALKIANSNEWLR